MLIDMKKIIAVLMSISLFLVVGAGCDNGTVPESSIEQSETATESGETYDFNGRTIRYVNWGHPGPTEVTPKREARIPELENKFNVTFEFSTIPMDQYNETFTSSTLAGDPMAEIVQMHIMWFYPGLVSKGFLTPLDDLGVFDFEDEKWDKVSMKYTKYDGKHYSLATGKAGPHGGVFWNKTIFERDGLPDLYELQNNYEWTWDKFRDIAIQATRDTTSDGNIDQWGIDSVGGQNSFIASNDAFMVDIIDDKPVFGLTEPNAIEALQFYQDLKINDEVFYTAPEESHWDYGLGQFAAGKTAMFVGSYWMSYMISESISDDWGFVFFPMGPKATEYAATFAGFNFPVMSSAVDKPEEVALFWEAFTAPFSDDSDDDWIAFYENQSPDRGTVDTIVKMVENELYSVNMVESFPELYALTGTMNGQISLGNMTAQAAVEMISNRANAILEEAMQ